MLCTLLFVIAAGLVVVKTTGLTAPETPFALVVVIVFVLFTAYASGRLSLLVFRRYATFLEK